MTAETLARAPSMLTLYPRAVLGSVLKKHQTTLPDAALSLTVKIQDDDRLRAYRQVCEFSNGDIVPGTWPHILAFPLHMSLMTRNDFPFPLLGLVHVANRIRVRKPIRIGDTLTLTCRFGSIQPHDKGRTFSLITEGRVNGELVWDSDSVMLNRGKTTSDANTSRATENTPMLTLHSHWTLPFDLGQRYAKASGDFNPIHLHPLSAKLFGFKRHISHGMWTKAHALAVLESSLAGKAYELDVQFKLPVFLPSEVQFHTASEGNRTWIAVRDASGEKPHLAATLTLI